MTAPHVLVVYAHPAPHKSRVNRRLADAARAVANVEVLDLYETYPDFYIDSAAEQLRLAAASAVVFVHPIQWYSSPALLKEWVDTALQTGWDGKALQGKTYWLVASTGGQLDAYREGGLHGAPFEAYLAPFRQTARFCGMPWEAPLVLHGAHRADDATVDAHVAAFTARLTRLATL